MSGDSIDFRQLFEGAPDVLLVLLPDAPRFTMVAASRSRFEVTHTSPETLGRGLFEVFPDNPDDVDATGTNNLRASLERVIATRKADTMAVQKYDIRGPDGVFQSRHWSPKNIPVLSATGEVQYILHRVEDVTDLVQASELGQELRDQTRKMELEVLARSRELAESNRNLREANTRLGELDRAKTAFFSNVSHEFRTPLTLILSPVERALGSAAAALGGEDLAAVHRNALRLLQLVNSLLDFSRIESEALVMSFAPVDVSRLTAGIVGAFQSLFDEAGLTLVMDCPPLPEPVFVDTTQWEKVVMNLVSNAFKFTLEGRVAVAVAWCGDRVELSVSDTGTGIPEAELPRMFERFHRVEGARGRSFEGSGIGLSLVHELVRLHGGSVTVTSELGRGSTFTVTIPSGRTHLPPERVVASAPSTSGVERRPASQLLEARQWMRGSGVREGPPASGRDSSPLPARDPAERRVLVAEDNADMRDFIQRLLSPHWATELVPNGRLALDSALRDPPDLVLSDMMMPEMDGAQLLDALRKNPATETVPVILISARAGEEARLAGLETGADDYLVKPFAARELLTRVRTQLEMARVRRAAVDAARALAETRAELMAELETEHAALQKTHLELKRTQAQLVQSAKMASIGQLVAGIAHELNNPLAFALGHVHTIQSSLPRLLPDGGASDPGTLESWTRITARAQELRNGLDRIRDLVAHLRTFSRLDEGELRWVSMRESIASVLLILRHRLRDGIAVDVQLGGPDAVECQAGPLNQAIMNLVSNAIEAIEGQGAISITTREHAGWFELAVADTGSGVPEAIRERIFEPFFTTKPVGSGTGLGLAITHSIAQQHGGTVELLPRETGGTLALFRFPLGKPAP